MEEILKTLVEIPSVTGNYKANNAALEYVDRYLSEYGLHVKRFEFNGVESLVATTRKTKKPKLLLAGHLDVVPALNTNFELHKEGDRLLGRGTLDMKGAVAVYLQLINDLNGSLQNYDLGLMLTTDEEAGGLNGTAKLIEEEGYSAEVVILPDAGDTPDGWKLECRAKGVLGLEITTNGKSAHGSRPWEGDNAILRLTMLLSSIHKMFDGQNHATDSINIGVINGGDAHNKVPAQASALIDIRTLSDDAADLYLKKIGELCQNAGAQVRVTVFGHACRTDVNNPPVKQYIELVKRVTGKAPLQVSSTGGSDARFFAKAGITCIVASPAGGGIHTNEEWASKTGLEQSGKVLRLYADKVAKISAAQTVDAEAVTV